MLTADLWEPSPTYRVCEREKECRCNWTKKQIRPFRIEHSTWVWSDRTVVWSSGVNFMFDIIVINKGN